MNVGFNVNKGNYINSWKNPLNVRGHLKSDSSKLVSVTKLDSKTQFKIYTLCALRALAALTILPELGLIAFSAYKYHQSKRLGLTVPLFHENANEVIEDIIDKK